MVFTLVNWFSARITFNYISFPLATSQTLWQQMIAVKYGCLLLWFPLSLLHIWCFIDMHLHLILYCRQWIPNHYREVRNGWRNYSKSKFCSSGPCFFYLPIHLVSFLLNKVFCLEANLAVINCSDTPVCAHMHT